MQKKKGIALVLSFALVACLGVAGVLAWLTDTTGEIENTFTVGNIDITLTEEAGGEAKKFKMVPGATIVKDPVATVLKGSENCYLFVKIEESATLDDYISYRFDSTKWEVVDTTNGTILRWIGTDDGIVVSDASDDQGFEILMGSQVEVNDSVTKQMMDDLAANRVVAPTLTFKACAVQSDNITLDEAISQAKTLLA